LLSPPKKPADEEAMSKMEKNRDTWHWIRMGILGGIVATGATLMALPLVNPSLGPEWVGHGSGIALQGLGLLGLSVWSAVEIRQVESTPTGVAQGE
jgi:hypothetical protein